MPGHANHAKAFFDAMAGENKIPDKSGGTLSVTKSGFYLSMRSGTGTRTLPSAVAIPEGVWGMIVNNTGSTVSLVGQADFDGGGTNTDIDLDDGEYAVVMVMENSSGVHIWRGLVTTGDYAT